MFETNDVNYKWSSEYYNNQCYAFKNFHQVLLQNNRCLTRTSNSYEDQISTSQRNCKRCVPFPRRSKVHSHREKRSRLRVCIFREDENMNRSKSLSDMFGVLDKLKTSLPDQRWPNWKRPKHVVGWDVCTYTNTLYIT